MKNILFVSTGANLDYQCDCLFHGIQSIDEIHIETIHDNWFMYTGNEKGKLQQLYGMGFSLTNRIPLEKKCVVTKNEAEDRIKNHFYDGIIYGSVFRNRELLDSVLQNYTRSEIVFVDGEDYDYTTTFSVKGIYHIPRDFRWLKAAKVLSQKGLYFKREITENTKAYFLPISFAIPEENIIHAVPVNKKREQAIIYPGKLDTYIYKTEDAYYQGYQEAKFGVTFKKAGWDCLRHYEILANGCIPYFPDLQSCPNFTMVTFPKNVILETNILREQGKMSDSVFAYYADWLLSYTKRYLTTKELAKYVLSYLF